MFHSASAFAAAAARSSRAVQKMGEGMKPGTIRVIATGDDYAAAVWRYDPEKRNFMGGGFDLKARLVFSIDKALLPAPFDDGEQILYVELGHAFAVEVTGPGAPGETAWRFEARRIPGGDEAAL